MTKKFKKKVSNRVKLGKLLNNKKRKMQKHEQLIIIPRQVLVLLVCKRNLFKTDLIYINPGKIGKFCFFSYVASICRIFIEVRNIFFKMKKKFVKLCLHFSYVLQTFLQFDDFFPFRDIDTRNLIVVCQKKFVKACLHPSYTYTVQISL